VKHLFHLSLVVALLVLLSPPRTLGQSDSNISLGDLARTLRKNNSPSAPVTIDNDNLSQVMDQVENQRLNGAPLFSMDGASKNFQMSSPDGTCSLSFSANATALLSVPYVAEDMPPSELAKLEGPASVVGDTLQVSLYNGSSWDLKEITVGLTLVRKESTTAHLANAQFLPVAANEEAPSAKPSDMTVLIHLKGAAAPLGTTVFSEKLGRALSPDQEWHWAIVQARGIPPSALSVPMN
jgi:hypothetical protein